MLFVMSTTKSPFPHGADPYHYVMKLFLTKWKPMILTAIYFDKGTTRYHEFTATLPIREKVLTENLRELEADGLILREEFHEVPPRVEYHLTELGESVIPLLFSLYDWGWKDMTRRGIPIDKRGQMYHGYLEPDQEIMSMTMEEYLKMPEDN
jgi:DNA-binding HxlR family transcriptional regulator